MNTLAAKLQRVTQKVADEERYAPPSDPAKIARYHSALAGYSADLADAVAKLQTMAARSPAMTWHNFYERAYKAALLAAREEQIFAIAATGLAWPQQSAFSIAVEAMRQWQPTIPHLRQQVPDERGLAVMEEFVRGH